MKFFYTFLLIFITTLFCGCKEAPKKLIMVTNASFPPYEYVSGSKICGIDPEIIGRIAEKLGYELEIQDMSFDSVLIAVQSGKADIAASGITITEERKKQISFTVPYIISEQLIIVGKNSPIDSATALKGKRIGVQHGTTGDVYVTENICQPERYNDGPTAVAALLARKIDAVVIDSEPARVYIMQNPGLKLLDKPLTYEEYAFAISKNNPLLLEKVNAELTNMKKSGELEQIIQHYKKLQSETAGNNIVSAGGRIFDKIKSSFEINFVKNKRYFYLIKGLSVTLQVTVFSVIIGIIIGFIVAVIRSCADQTGKLKFANMLCKIYLTVIRGTPVVVQLMIIYFVIFGAVNVDKVLVAIIAFGINSGAYVAEIIRSGIMSVDKGQMEAGRSLGLSYAESMRLIILPQAFKNVLPALGNEFIVLLKETSISGYIAIHDLTKGGDIIRSQTYDAFMPLIAVALIYLAIVMLLSYLLGILEKRLKKNE